MRKNKALYMWGAVTAVAIAAAVLDYQWDKRVQEQKSAEARILQLEVSQVKELELITETPSSITKDGVTAMTNKLHFINGEQGWMIKSPVEELADQNAVNGFIEWLVKERASVVPTGDKVDWASFGLEAPKGSVQLKDDQARVHLIAVSTRKNYEGDAFLRRNTEDKVLLGNAIWFTQVEKTIYDFRDKRILRTPLTDLKAFTIKRGKESLTVQKSEAGDGKWMLPAQPKWKIDQNRVREVLAQLTGPLIVEFKKEGAIKPADLKEFALEKPELILEVETESRLEEEGKTWTAELSRKAGDKAKSEQDYVRINEPSVIAALNPSEVERIVSITAESLRDRHTPFAIDRDKLSALEVQKKGFVFKAKKQNAQWQIAEKTEGSKAEAKDIIGLVERIRNLEVGEFLTEKSNDTFKDSTEILMKDPDGKLLLSLNLSSPRKRKLGGEDRDVVLVKSSLTDEVLSLEKDQIEALGIAALIGENMPEGKNEKNQ